MAKETRRLLGLVLLGVTIGILLLTAPGWAQISTTPPLRVSYGGPAGYNLPVWVLREYGLVKRYGLDLEVILLPGEPLAIQALLGRSTQLAQLGGRGVVGAALKGANIIAIAASLNHHVFSLISHPNITNPTNLKGKRIGVIGLGTLTHMVGKLAVEALGLDPKDVVFVQLHASGARLVAFEAGLIDATVQTYPELFKLKQKGYRVLVDARDLKAYFPTSTITVTRDYLQKNRELVKNFLRAYVEALHIIRNNREATTRILAKYSKIDDREALNQTYDFFAPMMEGIPKPKMEGIGAVLKELREREDQGRLRAEDLVDASLLDELEQEGFFNR